MQWSGQVRSDGVGRLGGCIKLVCPFGSTYIHRLADRLIDWLTRLFKQLREGRKEGRMKKTHNWPMILMIMMMRVLLLVRTSVSVSSSCLYNTTIKVSSFLCLCVWEAGTQIVLCFRKGSRKMYWILSNAYRRGVSENEAIYSGHENRLTRTFSLQFLHACMHGHKNPFHLCTMYASQPLSATLYEIRTVYSSQF